MRRSHFLAIAIALALAGWLASGQLGDADTPAESEESAAAAGDPPVLPAVQVRMSEASGVDREVRIYGRTEAVRDVELKAEVRGRIVETPVAKGSFVEKGEVIARIDPREREAMLEQARAEVEQRALQYEAARKLGEQGYQARTRVAEARAQLRAAEAAAREWEIAVADSEIKAPFSGIVEERAVETGAYVAIGDSVATLLQQDPFLITGEVNEIQGPQIEIGMPVEATLATGREVEGEVRYVASQAAEGTRTFRIEMEIDNPGAKRFPANITATARIALETVQAHKVSSALLTLNDAGVLGIKILDVEDRVRFVEADIVNSEGGMVWLAGLPETARLIVVGQGFVAEGDRVRPVPAEEVEGAGARAGAGA